MSDTRTAPQGNGAEPQAGALVTIRTRLPFTAEAKAHGLTAQQWRVLVDAIFPSARSPEAICLALDYCHARKLDPFKRPVNIVPVWNSSLGREVETVWPGINETQVTAARSGKWAGMDEPRWGPLKTRTFKGQRKQSGSMRSVETTLTFPEWCAITVYRIVEGEKAAFSEPVWWEEAYGRTGRSELPNDMWAKRVRGQLAKVAKAASLRAAFPEDIGNDYTADEMEGQEIEAGGIVIEGEAEVLQRHEPPDDEPPEEAPAPPQRTLRMVQNAIEDAAKAALTPEDLDQLERDDDVRKVRTDPRVPPARLAETEGVLAFHRARVAAFQAPPEADPFDIVPEELQNPPAPTDAAEQEAATLLAAYRSAPTRQALDSLKNSMRADVTTKMLTNKGDGATLKRLDDAYEARAAELRAKPETPAE